ncbi:AcvB/VirJ family lysyl-phosphatidylglycerol hydrolase [Sphingobacterium sp.]|uniref:AcvB/VirJ family lysyl-phosphatidylglycerol hydrolase n=1 Tax=Sphingobacterium sp. TaxID=341027 RepID=UPI00289A9975|nr:AcvB/VirJ family lysyl-phosphatidylglycerol hydrolase [Sphingobacterium sp.]
MDQPAKRSFLVLYFFMILFSQRVVAQQAFSYGSFGKLTMYVPKGKPNALVLFVSGDGGWQFGVINMAKFLAAQGALVAGIDAKHFTASMARSKKDCYYPAADFEQLSMALQKKYNFESYQKPILVGYSYGATLIYGLIAQAPAGTFRGGIALGFCPDINIAKPLCKGSGLASHVLKPGKSYYLDRSEKLAAPFWVLNGMKDQTCPFNATADFLKGIENVQLVTLPKVGHGFSIADNWLPQFRMAFQKLQAVSQPSQNASALKTDMPIEILEPKSPVRELMFMISGDGGWTSFDKELANTFTTKGIKVIGLDAQKYFWNAKTPEQTTKEVTEILTYFQEREPTITFSIMGYSFGACVIPFIANRLPEKLKKATTGLFLLSPDDRADFEIHVTDMLSFGNRSEPYDVVAELKKVSLRKLCIFGAGEDSGIEAKFRNTGALVEILPGGHHFDNDYEAIVAKITGFRGIK